MTQIVLGSEEVTLCRVVYGFACIWW